MDEVHLTRGEASDLVRTIVEAAEAIDSGKGRISLPLELRDWALMLLDRREGGGTNTT